MEQTNAEVGREHHQVMGVLMDTLIRVHANFTSAGKVKRAPWHEPLVEQIVRERVAQFQLAHLSEPGLGDVQGQQRPGNHPKHHELVQKTLKILKRQRIVERLVPGIEPDLAEGGQCDHGAEGGAEANECVAARRMKKGCDHHPELRRELLVPRCSRRLAPEWFFGLVSHLRPIPFSFASP